MKKLIIFLDIDGTLLNSKQEISSYTKEKLISLQKEGHSIVLASGRDIESLSKIGEKIQIQDFKQSGYLALNGLEMYDYQLNCIYHQPPLSYLQLVCLNEMASDLKFDMILFTPKSLYLLEYGQTHITDHHFMNRKKYYPKSFNDIPHQELENIKKVAFVQFPQHIESYHHILRDYQNQFEICRVEDDWIEINPKGATKGQALLTYCSLNHYTYDISIAFGNGENDMDMLANADIGVAMRNAFENVKQAANAVCGDNDHDGIAYYLDAMIKS